MIKLTIHESVEAALENAFPKPAGAAGRALTKYISVVEAMLFDALQRGQTPEQRKFALYAISLNQLANKGGQIGPNKVRVHKWLTDNDLDIVQTVVKGTKFSGQYSHSWNYRARVWVASRYRQFLLPHLDQVLRGQAHFFAIHTHDDAGVGFDC